MMISLLNRAGGRQTKGIKADNLGFCLDICSHNWTALLVVTMMIMMIMAIMITMMTFAHTAVMILIINTK